MNAVEISVSENTLSHPAKKKLAAKRFAIISRVLRDHGLTAERIQPVLASREENSFALRIVNKDYRNATLLKDDDFADLIRTRTVPVQTW